MVSEPFRFGPVFGATLNVTVPSSVPLAPAVTVIHATLLAAVHAQLLVVLTSTLRVPPLAPMSCLFGEIEYEQGATAACVAVNVWPAIVTVPVRAPPRFGAMPSPTSPFPVPLAPDSTAIHDALLDAVHAHPLCVLTSTLSPPPDALKL
jgi:hypothetical protein